MRKFPGWPGPYLTGPSWELYGNISLPSIGDHLKKVMPGDRAAMMK